MSVQTISKSLTTPSKSSGSGVTATSNSFSPLAGSLAVAFFRNTTTGGSIASVTDSLGGTWTKKVSGIGDFQIWERSFSTTPGSLTVIGTYNSTANWTVDVLVLDSAASSQTGATTTVNFGSGSAPATAALTTTKAGSIAVGIFLQSVATTPTALTNQTLTLAAASTFDSSDTWVQWLTVPAGALGSTITLGVSAPAATGWAFCACEIIAADAVSPFSKPHGGAWTPASPAKKAHSGSWV